MIWIDSSFAVEWLLDTPRARRIRLGGESTAILPMQYLETLVFFLKQGLDAAEIMAELDALEIFNPQKADLTVAGRLYLKARERRSKASMADALLAGAALVRKEKIATFDRDFASLGFKERDGLWEPVGI